jgi:hypothetical protein
LLKASQLQTKIKSQVIKLEDEKVKYERESHYEQGSQNQSVKYATNQMGYGNGTNESIGQINERSSRQNNYDLQYISNVDTNMFDYNVDMDLPNQYESADGVDYITKGHDN